MRFSIVGAPTGQVAAAGGKNIKVTRSANIIFADLTSSQAAELKAKGFTVAEIGKVKSVVQPPTPPLASVETPRTATELAEILGIEGAKAAYSPPLSGLGYKIAIVGTGIRASHYLLASRVILSTNYTTGQDGDTYNHDTGVASIIVAITPMCEILDIKVLDDEGWGTEENVVGAVDDLLALHDSGSELAPHIINLSLGSTDTGNPNEPMRVICREAIQRGIYVFASAGNGGPADETVMSPASERYVFAVGSARYEPFTVSDFSSRGPTLEGLMKPDALFFGENVVIASSVNDVATTVVSGTSFACPFAAASVALLLESLGAQNGAKPTIDSVIDVRLPIVCIKPDGAPAGKDAYYGNGIPVGAMIVNGQVSRIDIGSFLPMFLVVGMMGMVMKSAK